MVLRQVMLQHLRAVLEEAARKTSTSQMRRVYRELMILVSASKRF